MSNQLPRIPRSVQSSLGRFSMVPIVLIAIVLGIVWMGIYRIDAGHVGIVKRFGNVIDVVDPGLHVKIPYADTV
jgi:regulator of protease activity HflC (stomatin/prohibitin superfamily)